MAWNTSEKALELFIIQICCTILVYISHVIYDKLMYISVFLYTAQVIIIVRGIVDGGIGQHADDIGGVEVVKGFQTVLYLHRLYIGEPSKGAIVNKPILRISLIVCLVCVWATSIQFKHPVRPGTCSKSIVPIAGIVLSVVLALSDWTLALVVPIMSLWKSWLPWQTKAAIHALTSLGVLAGAAMIVRIPYIKMLDLTEDFLRDIERGTKQDTIQNNRDTILIHTDFFLSESFVNNSDNHVRHDPNDSFRHDQWRP
ncbi:hypothetical protein BKA60DRAFT_601639 [Fusarium oxysporum]|nr:hypothetical protein BKA60DRAFT_601639 [Fusarium oxysporum]